MSPDVTLYLLLGVALFVFGYLLGRSQGRKAEQESAARIAPLPDGANRTQDGPPPKNRV